MLSREVFAQLGAELAYQQKQAMTKEAIGIPGAGLARSAISGIGSLASKHWGKATALGGTGLGLYGANKMLSGPKAAPQPGAPPAPAAAPGTAPQASSAGSATAFDPATKDPAERFLAAKGDYNRLVAQHDKQIAERKAYEGSDSYNSLANRLGRWLPGMAGYSADELQKQRESPEFGKTHTAAGTAAQAEMAKQYGELTGPADMGPLQQKYNTLQAQMKTAPFEAQRALIGKEMAKLQGQMTTDPMNSQAAKQLRSRMISMGMNDPMVGMAEPRDLPPPGSPSVNSGPSYGDYAALAAGNYDPYGDPNAGQLRPGMSGFR